MTIEFVEEKITAEQVVIPRIMRAPELATLKNGEWTYMADNSVWMDREGALWIDELATSFKGKPPEVEIEEDSDETIGFVRVMKLPEGYIVDITQDLESFRDKATGQLAFEPQNSPETESELYPSEAVPVVGLLFLDEQVEFFRDLVRKQYGYDYPEALTSPGN